MILLFLTPGRGLLASYLTRSRQNRETLDCLVLQWIQEEGNCRSSSQSWLKESRWQGSIRRLVSSELIVQSESKLSLTAAGTARLSAKLAEFT